MDKNKTNLGLPDLSPGEVSKKIGVGVRRVNNLPVYMIGGAVVIFFLIMLFALSGRGNKKIVDEAAESTGKGGSSLNLAELAAGSLDAGIVASAPVVPAEEIISDNLDMPPVLIAHPDAPDLAPEESALEKRYKTMKLAQLEQAIKSTTTLGRKPTRSQGSAPTDDVKAGDRQRGRSMAPQNAESPNQNQLFQQTMEGLRGAGSGGNHRPNNDLAQFSGDPKDDRWRLGKSIQAPRTLYELRAGFVIPATLISGINSELPGQIIGQVTQDVYDTATGKYKLIPQGSRLVGAYTSDIAYGQSRLMAAWQRIIFPDGKALDIGAMPAADSAGYAGLSDQVNNHYFRIFGSALLLSGVTAGMTHALDKGKEDRGNVPSIQDSLNAALANQLGQVAIEMIRKNMNIAPTLEIRPGFRLNVMVVKDLTFTKPYQAFDY